METIESITPAPISGELDDSNLIETKKYELASNDDKNDKYQLTLEIYSSGHLFFRIRSKEKISYLTYDKIFNYDEIVKILLLETNYYNNISKVFKFCDTAISKGKVMINYEKDKKGIKFCLKKPMDFEEVECSFYLEQKKLKNQEMIALLSEELNNLKFQKNNINKLENSTNNAITNNINNNDKNYKILENKIKTLEEKNEILEIKLNSIIDENSNLRKIIIDLQETIKKLEGKNSNNNNQFESSNKKDLSNIDFKFKEVLTSSHTNSGFLRQFAVYSNKNDGYDYLV